MIVAKKAPSASGRTGSMSGDRPVGLASERRATVRGGKLLKPKTAARAGMVLTHPKSAKTAPGPMAASTAVSTAPFLAAVMKRVHLPPQVARSLESDFQRVLDAQLLRPERARAAPLRVEAADPVLTTQEAADLVGVSRPFMAARIDAGEIALHHMAGNQRRVLQSAVLAWKERFRQGQLRAMAKLGADLDGEIFTG